MRVSRLDWIRLVVLTEWIVREKTVRYLTVMSGKSTERTTKQQMVELWTDRIN